MSNIITLSDLAASMPTTTLNSPVATQVVAAVNQYIENRTNRCWGTTTTITERYDWAPRIWLHHQDVQSIGFIKLGYPGLTQSTLDSTSYLFNEYGRVTMYLMQPTQFNPSAVNNDLVQIQYTYGQTNVPEDLILAALGIAANFYNWAINGNKDVVAASVGSYRLEFSGAVRGAGGGANGDPPASTSTNQVNWNIIDSYRMQRV